MKKIFLIALTLTVFFTAGTAFCQEDQPAITKAPETQAVSGPAEAQPKEISIYGEVKLVDPVANSMAVQYYDYDTDEEKTTSVTIDQDTKMENAASLKEIKQGDWVDITYTVKDAKNIARTVIVEKEEMSAETPPATPEEE